MRGLRYFMDLGQYDGNRRFLNMGTNAQEGDFVKMQNPDAYEPPSAGGAAQSRRTDAFEFRFTDDGEPVLQSQEHEDG